MCLLWAVTTSTAAACHHHPPLTPIPPLSPLSPSHPPPLTTTLPSHHHPPLTTTLLSPPSLLSPRPAMHLRLQALNLGHTCIYICAHTYITCTTSTTTQHHQRAQQQQEQQEVRLTTNAQQASIHPQCCQGGCVTRRLPYALQTTNTTHITVLQLACAKHTVLAC